MADLDPIIRKIQACLRLSKSANEHEAAAAIRHGEKARLNHGVGQACNPALAAS